MTGPAEALSIHRDINATALPYPDKSSVKELFESCAEEFGTRTAVVCGAEVLSYRDLNGIANGMAERLRQRGVGPGDCVALCVERSTDLIVSLLAIIKCGAAYLPLNSSWPNGLLRRILGAFKCRLVLLGRDGSLAEQLPADRVLFLDPRHVTACRVNPGAEVDAEAVAYINFTSGTTGDPKGVPIQHRGIARLVFGAAYAPLDKDSVLLHMSPVTFDAATFEIWGALLCGGTCVLYPSAHLRISTLRNVVCHGGVSVAFVTTALFNAIVDEAPDTLDSVGTVLTGGERYSHRHIGEALRRYGPGRLVHVYGPTECTTFSTYHPVNHLPEEPGMLPIGKPIQNTRVYVVREERLCRPGEIGEILIAGPGLSPGYLGTADDNRAAFAHYDIGGVAERVYRTGDYGYLLGSGDLIFEGRRDDQIKVNGFRIELAELSRVIGDHPRVREIYVTVAELVAGDKILVAFVVGHSPSLTVPDVVAYVQARVPSYMVPAVVELRDRLPLTASGKVDRQALLADCRMIVREPSDGRTEPR